MVTNHVESRRQYLLSTLQMACEGQAPIQLHFQFILFCNGTLVSYMLEAIVLIVFGVDRL